EPQKRYASAAAVAEDLEHWLAGEPIRARPATTVERLVKWGRRGPARAALAADDWLAAVELVVGLSVGLAVLPREEHEAVEAKQVAVKAKGEADDAREKVEDALRQVNVLMESEKRTSEDLRKERDNTKLVLERERRNGYLQSIVLASRELETQRTGQ